VLWDSYTRRFYYAAAVTVATNDYALAFGFSKTDSPNNVTSDWCHYIYSYATRRPNSVRLGDNRDFIIIGANAFQPSFVGTDITAIRKPSPALRCPSSGSFKKGTQFSLRNTDGVLVGSAVPANQIDDLADGTVIATDATPIPGTKLWLYSVAKDQSTGGPVFSTARGLPVTSYTPPPAASQPNSQRKLRTGDARLGQAVQAHNPQRTTGISSLWTQHTISHPSQPRSVVRWYEIDPFSPTVMRSGLIGGTDDLGGNFYFNAAISPDRVNNGEIKKFGDSFVIHYNVSSAANDISPRLDAASSVKGGPLTSRTIRNGVGPYQDFSCPLATDLCEWGGAAAAPDPNPPAGRERRDRGVVWGINQYSGAVDPSLEQARAEWWARFFALQP
jgi:hypothetical protein